MKNYLLLFALMLGLSSASLTAQSVLYKGEKYEVQDAKILKNGEDVSYKLSQQDRMIIYRKYNREVESLMIRAKQDKELQKNKKKEKRLKKTEKELKRKKNAKKSLTKAEKKLKQEKKKFKKLKEKNKLDNNDYLKWEKKLEKLNENVLKAKKRFKRS